MVISIQVYAPSKQSLSVHTGMYTVYFTICVHRKNLEPQYLEYVNLSAMITLTIFSFKRYVTTSTSKS